MTDFLDTQGYDQEFFGCLNDPVLTVATACVPCLVVGKVQGDIEGSGFNIFAALCSGIGAYRIRRYVQQRFNIKESEDASMMAVGLCGCCAVAQDAHELMKRGIIPSLAGGSASEQQPMQPTNQMSVQQPSPVYPPGGKENV